MNKQPLEANYVLWTLMNSTLFFCWKRINYEETVYRLTWFLTCLKQKVCHMTIFLPLQPHMSFWNIWINVLSFSELIQLISWQTNLSEINNCRLEIEIKSHERLNWGYFGSVSLTMWCFNLCIIEISLHHSACNCSST